VSADDVIRRRTTCFFRGLDSESTQARVESLLAEAPVPELPARR
jgi:hypothetical protein